MAVPKPSVPEITTSMTLHHRTMVTIEIAFTPPINFIPHSPLSLSSSKSQKLAILKKIEAHIAVQRENMERVRYNFKIRGGTTFSCRRL